MKTIIANNIESKNATRKAASVNRCKVECKIWYYEPYLPKRCRKLRYEKREEVLPIGIPSVTSEEAPVAFRLSDYHYEKMEQKTEVRAYRGKLYERMTMNDMYAHGGFDNVKPEQLADHIRIWTTLSTDRTRELVTKEMRKESKKYIVVDGCVWEQCGEPRYVVNTFGLGHNHGGTGLFVEKHYNPNIANRNYFSALDGDKAVTYANQVAERRGDTEDVGKFEKMIEVLMPEMVKVKPMQQHGDGDPFLNRLDRLTSNCKSASEAGLKVLCAAFAGI
jgi:hypothetical protein